ncbi:cell division protein FtsI/penicillin-binding protein 2/cell division protein FtsW (lipid II flippase) [Pseudonocardia eucalypti]|uniref:FtsW/RodA/SpoVE family cell cycle protein n=1 Tax=Pseudonocardia eucalypti TaxID=648755 RepID=UPI00161B95E9|nr:cell division protein FtsI/penicillin-binding protein 2/cell division protein FtsW (lipid II flippase) [Pseudonocardia eucalypti]
MGYPVGKRVPAGLPREHLRGGAFDLVAVASAVVLVGLGVANLYAVSGFGLAARQAVVALLGLALLGWLWRFRVRLLAALGWACYAVAIFFLLAVLVVGSSAKGATRWIDLGAVSFQPSELVKLGMLLVVASALGSAEPSWRRFALAVPLALAPIALTVVQPDLSTAALLTALAVVMLVLGRVPGRFLLSLVGAGVVAAPLAVGLLRPYQLERLGSFLAGSHTDPAGAGWAVQQARIALGSAGLLGPGQPLTHVLSQYLPERDTDLAVASVVEQFGVGAGAAVVLAALVLVWRLALATRATRNAHGALLAGGLAALIGVETTVSLGGNLGLLPLAGVPFPLLSYGGSALLVHLAALGVVLGVRRDGVRRPLWAVGSRRARRPRMVRAVALAITVLLLSFGHYGWRVRATEGPELAAAGQRQMTRCFPIPAPRGAITDRHGAPLAVSATDGMLRVFAVPALVREQPGGPERLAELTGQPVDTVRSALWSAPPTTLAVPVADVPAGAGPALARTGVILVDRARRDYPTGILLGPVLGYTGLATPTEMRRWPDLPLGQTVGRAGLEQQYDAVLRGIDGEQCVYVDPHGVPVAMGSHTEPVAGANLRLALDLGLQRVLHDRLVAAMRSQPGRIGAGVAMDPRNGQVLALASVPGYDNHIYGPPLDAGAVRAVAGQPGSPMRQHAAQTPVPPGSTFKLVIAAANQLYPVYPADRVIPTGASFTLGGHTFNNWKGMGPMDLRQSLAWSNDVYFYKLAVGLGPDKMISTADALGVGRPTGIDLPHESPGYLGTPASVRAKGGTWYGGSTVILGIGQGYLTTTPLQNARWTAAVATGQLVTPRLGLATGTDESNYLPLPAPPPTALPFAHLLGPVRDGMRAAVTGGTAGRLATLPAPVGAKTGTAQDGALPDHLYDNWISVAAPHDAPSIVLTAMVQGTGTGENSATAVAREALDHYLAHQRAEPSGRR